MRSLPLVIIGLTACAHSTGVSPVNQASYFESPEQAVEVVTRLLRDEQFEELSRYYDLAGTDLDREQLSSGKFFVRSERPEAAHPGGFWRYREPFAPGFEYDSHTVDGDVATVRVTIAIDQGDGTTQRGEVTFRMRTTARGWQLLPSQHPESSTAETAEPSPPPPWE